MIGLKSDVQELQEKLIRNADGDLEMAIVHEVDQQIRVS